jgi:hypothetical protein
MTVCYPRFLKLRYTLDGFLRELAPYGIFGKGLTEEEFTATYWPRLDGIGADVIRARLDEMHTASPSGGPLRCALSESANRVIAGVLPNGSNASWAWSCPSSSRSRGCCNDNDRYRGRGDEPDRDRACTSRTWPLPASPS